MAKKAEVIQKRRPKRVSFPSDEESIVLRQQNAERERAKVGRVAMLDDFHGLFEVSSTQWEHPYRIEIRSLAERNNSCSCQDYRMNRLGSCKHIERVLQSVQHRKKRAFARAAEAGSPVYEIFMDVREPERREVPAVERRPKRLKEELTARHADIILGIEQNVKTGGTVVVSRPGTDTESLRRTAKAAGASAEVITPEIHALLLRLQKMGVLTLSSELDTLHATAGYTPLLSESPSPPKLHRAAARSVWTSVAAERRAVEALTGVGLLEQALPHLTAVLAAGRKAIAVLHRGPDADEDAGATELPTEARALSSVLAAFDGREDGDAVQEGLDLVAQVDAELAD